MEQLLILIRALNFRVQLICALSGFLGVLAYYIYFRIRVSNTQKGNPPSKSNLALLNTLVGIPTAWIWFLMPLMPQPRFEGVISLFKGDDYIHPVALLSSCIGLVIIGVSGYYLGVVEKVNLKVTQKNYTAPETLLTTGIYGVVRHPIVTFTTFMLLGICLLSGAYYTALFIPVFFLICFLTSLIEERFALQLNFPDEFPLYKKSTPGYFNARLAILLFLVILVLLYNYLFISVS